MADPDYHAAIRKGYEWGVKEERERIIALLEAVDDELGIFGVGWNMQEIAELIRGEN